MHMKCIRSILFFTIGFILMTDTCCGRSQSQDWVDNCLPANYILKPNSLTVDTEGVAHIYSNYSRWMISGNPEKGWLTEEITTRDLTWLDITTEENETHAALICSNADVVYQWRKPDDVWRDELLESFPPNSLKRVEIERAPDGTIWLATFNNDQFYLFEHTPYGWNDFTVGTRPSQLIETVNWGFEMDWNNKIHLVHQINASSFYHISGTPGEWSSAMINNIEGMPGDGWEIYLDDMEMRKDNTPILHTKGFSYIDDRREEFGSSIFNNDGIWKVVDTFLTTGAAAYDYARDRVHFIEAIGEHRFDPKGRYWSTALSEDSRQAYTPGSMMYFIGRSDLFIGKLDLPHFLAFNGNYQYFRPISDMYIRIDQIPDEVENIIQIVLEVTNWKWERPARLGAVVEIVGDYFWLPEWSQKPSMELMSYNTGNNHQTVIKLPAPSGQYGIPVTIYVALLHPMCDELLNFYSWDSLTVVY